MKAAQLPSRDATMIASATPADGFASKALNTKWSKAYKAGLLIAPPWADFSDDVDLGIEVTA
jgi:hypothetical protein